MKHSRAGFSLIEVIVSGALVATTVGGLFALASMTTRLTSLGQDRLIAGQLAREGIEVTRQVRDANFVADACSPQTPCPSWYTGLYGSPSDLPLARGIDTDDKNGFKLVDKQGDFECTDYIIRDTSSGSLTVAGHKPPTLEPRQQLFCRRIFLEPVADASVLGSETKESQDAVRVRSQVAWTGFGRASLRHYQSGSLQAQNECSPAGTEWCTEQVTLLTNWRPAL